MKQLLLPSILFLEFTTTLYSMQEQSIAKFLSDEDKGRFVSDSPISKKFCKKIKELELSSTTLEEVGTKMLDTIMAISSGSAEYDSDYIKEATCQVLRIFDLEPVEKLFFKAYKSRSFAVLNAIMDERKYSPEHFDSPLDLPSILYEYARYIGFSSVSLDFDDNYARIVIHNEDQICSDFGIKETAQKISLFCDEPKYREITFKKTKTVDPKTFFKENYAWNEKETIQTLFCSLVACMKKHEAFESNF